MITNTKSGITTFKSALVLATATLATLMVGACTSVPVKTFHVEAINTKGEPVKCMIVVEHRWPQPGDANKTYFTPAEVPIEFPKSVVHVQVKEARMVDGKPVKPKSDDRSKYKTRGRDIKMNFPSRLLLILDPSR